MFIIRQERETDYKTIKKLVEEAFRNVVHSDHNEHLLVERLRKSDDYIDKLSLVAEFNGQIVGHIMLSKLIIESSEERNDSLALAPLSVLPDYQNKGIGSKLIKEALRLAKETGYKSVIVLGDNKYYSMFGFKPASNWKVKAPFEVADEYFMALELEDGGLDGVRGTVAYSKEFLE